MKLLRQASSVARGVSVARFRGVAPSDVNCSCDYNCPGISSKRGSTASGATEEECCANCQSNATRACGGGTPNNFTCGVGGY